MRGLSVGIVGCGTAGPASALLLSRAGHHVTLFERVEQPGPVGAGIVFETLFNEVKATREITLRLGIEVRSVERSNGKPELLDSTGAPAPLAPGLLPVRHPMADAVLSE